MNFTRQPFQYDVDTAFFFTGGARGHIVDDMKTALSEGVSLVTLTGTDGSGKTMICRKVEQDLGETHQILFFEQGVESFDEVIEGLSALIGTDLDDKTTDRNLRLKKIAETLKQENRRLIVIIDAAEAIFLATLERIRKMVDLANGEGVTIQLVLSGQPLFLLNFKQLGIVAFNDIEERNYSLDPLDAEITYEYLNHCIEIAAGSDQDFFSPRMADRIMDTARGNIRLINRLADRYISSGSLMDPEVDGFDEVQTDDAPVGSVEENGRIHAPARLGNVDLDFLKVPRLRYRWYVVAGGIAGLILVAFLLIGGDDEPAESGLETEQVPDLTLDKVEPDPIEIPDTVEQPRPIDLSKKIPAVEPVIEPVVGKINESPEKASETAESPEVAESQGSEVNNNRAVSPPSSEKMVERVETTEVSSGEEIVKPEVVEETASKQVVAEVPATELEQDDTTQPDVVAVVNEKKQGTPAEQNIEHLTEPDPVVEPIVVQSESELRETAEREDDEQGRAVSQESVASTTDVQSKPSVEYKPTVEDTQTASADSTMVEGDVERDLPAILHEPEITEVTADPEIAEVTTEPEIAEVTTEPEIAEVTAEPEIAEVTAEPEIAESATLYQSSEAISSDVAEITDTVEVPATPQTTEDQQDQEQVVSAESIQIPELTVVTKKKQRTEAVPFTIVTLKDERKRLPEVQAPVPVPKPKLATQSSEQQQPAAIKQTEEKSAAPPPEPQIESVAAQKTAPPAPSLPQTRSTAKPLNPRVHYAERLAAGSRWLVGGGRGKYTVQLMVLQSDLAEKNIGKMLNEEGYQPIKNQTYILRKAGQPQMVTLYFGEFNSQEEARQAQTQLPQFLKDLNPYAVAVIDAVDKARNVQ